MESTRNILLLDGDDESARDIQRFLKVSAYAFSLSHASDVSEALNYIKNRAPELILLDAELIKEKEFAAFKLLAQKQNIPLILLSDLSVDETRKQAQTVDATDYLIKNKINLFHLQKTIANALRINETEAKLDNKLNEFEAKHDALYKLLNKINSGVLVINAQNTIQYANTKAYSILGEEGIQKQLTDYLNYRAVEEEQSLELKPNKNTTITIRISDLEWNGERANLFLLDRIKSKEKRDDIFSDDFFTPLLNALNENILLVKTDKIIHANKAALKNLKLKQSEINQLALAYIFESNEVAVPEISVKSFLTEKKSEGIIKFADGSVRSVVFSLKPLHLDDELYQLLSFEIKGDSPENIPSARSDEEKFSTEGVLHIASHDLREPVRTIINYVQLISENLNKGKIEQAKEYSDFAKAAADRMEKLLNDLKAYIGLNDHKFKLSKVSMKLVLNDVLKQLKTKIDEQQAEISFTELPEVNADRELVEKLFLQLIDNALKFRKKGKAPVIDIGFDKFEGNVIFCVRDNGIGISKRYYQKIFELFEKLNRVDEYPGNGLGLSICKKITDMHGGEIWVESLPGSGSNFYFTLRGK